jgi:hypothetical protein
MKSAAPRTIGPEKQLALFMAKYSPAISGLAEEAVAMMRARLPGAFEIVYDNYNALVIGFGPSERPSEAIFSIALYPKWVTLFFLHGAALNDPGKLLKGSGRRVRHVVIRQAADLDTPGVRDLVSQAVKPQGASMTVPGPRRLVIRSVSAKQRPRRPISLD